MAGGRRVAALGAIINYSRDEGRAHPITDSGVTLPSLMLLYFLIKPIYIHSQEHVHVEPISTLTFIVTVQISKRVRDRDNLISLFNKIFFTVNSAPDACPTSRKLKICKQPPGILFQETIFCSFKINSGG